MDWGTVKEKEEITTGGGTVTDGGSVAQCMVGL
jgi:hypothetical protein